MLSKTWVGSVMYIPVGQLGKCQVLAKVELEG